jgi:hypothetical protein
VQRSVTGALGGSISYNWDEAGTVITLKLSPERLAH